MTSGTTSRGIEDRAQSTPAATAAVLLLDGDVLTRDAVATYLRGCGFTVLEAATVAEARTILQSGQRVDVAFLDVDVEGDGEGNAFALATWIRREHGSTKVILAAGPARTASEAGELCENGPMLAKPYDHQLLEREIRRLLVL